MSKIIGIDLGTSNSAAAVMIGGKPSLIPSAEGTSVGGKSFPSYIAFTKDGQRLVGEPARRQAVTNPEGTVQKIKRKMGESYKVHINGNDYTPEQLSAFILQKIKTDAEAFLGEKVEKAVVTVPAYFNDNQRQATKDAGSIAGLDVVRIINEPTAASLAYGLDKEASDQKILVFDLGGGTLDVTVMEFGDSVFEVKSTSGDTKLGGADMDQVILDYLVDTFVQRTSIDLRNDSKAMQRLREGAEKAKIELSTVLTTDINLPFIAQDSEKNPIHFETSLTRAKLEDLISVVLNKCEMPIKRAIEDSKLSVSDIDKVILVGGPTRMPSVQEFVKKIVGKGLERGVDPMECVAAGAAIQGAVLAGETSDILLLDVTPLSLGVEVQGGICNRMIERNTTIPTKKSQIYSTAQDNQPAVTIHILQGEREMASDNKSLGQFNLDGIPPAPRGVPQIEVTFDIDANGIINVSAKDLATNKEQKITVTGSSKLSDTDKERMIKDAEQFAEQDKNRKDEAELINKADSLIYTAERTKTDLKDKITEDQISQIDSLSTQLKSSLESKDPSSIRDNSDKLSNLLQEIGSSVYQQSTQPDPNQPPPSDQSGPTTEPEEKVVDGEYSEVDDNSSNDAK
ncbi:MAG: molecular chaperone DnaK [Nitrososphaerales archaeon]|nr:molecular chaperone DnaK [Nitrososphaerales archaeon]